MIRKLNKYLFGSDKDGKNKNKYYETHGGVWARKINFNQRLNVIGNYQISRKLGQGTYGLVYRAMDLKTSKNVALKKIRLEVINDEEGFPSTALREITLLKELSHKNVVKLLQVIYKAGKLYLVFEYVTYDLKKYIDKHDGPIPGNLIRSCLKQILEGLKFCHLNRVIHRDLKPQNVLVHKNGVLKIADFGLARTFQIPYRTYTHEIVTLWYRAPEILMGITQYDTSVDIWSVGMIFGEMITKRPIFPGDSEIDQLFKIFRQIGTPKEDNWPGVSSLKDYKDCFPRWNPQPWDDVLAHGSSSGPKANIIEIHLMEKMCTMVPWKRPNTLQLLTHPYFNEFT